MSVRLTRTFARNPLTDDGLRLPPGGVPAFPALKSVAKIMTFHDMRNFLSHNRLIFFQSVLRGHSEGIRRVLSAAHGAEVAENHPVDKSMIGVKIHVLVFGAVLQGDHMVPLAEMHLHGVGYAPVVPVA